MKCTCNLTHGRCYAVIYVRSNGIFYYIKFGQSFCYIDLTVKNDNDNTVFKELNVWMIQFSLFVISESVEDIVNILGQNVPL